MQNTLLPNSSLPLPPGSFGLPIIGETLNFLKDSDFVEKRRQKYGSIFKTHLFGRPNITLLGAEANRFMLTNENKYFVATWPKSTRVLLGPHSLSTNTGEFHTSRRKLIYQAFQPRALASYIPTIERITARYLTHWEQMGTLTWYPELKSYAFDIISTLIFGQENTKSSQLAKLFNGYSEGLFSLTIPLPWSKFSQAVRCRDALLKQIEQIVTQRQADGNLGSDVLGMLLQATDESGDRLSLAELKDQVLVLLFAGHETITSALASFGFLIAQYPAVLTRIREEQARLDISKSLTLEKLKELTYLEQVLKEVLRFIPPVAGGFREIIQDCEFNNYLLPKGWTVQYSIAKTLSDESIYTNPKQFDPDRFSTERAEDKQYSFGYIPFGGGMRECLGKEFAKLELKIFATLSAQNYNWTLLPNQNLELTAIPTPHPRDGLKITLLSVDS